MTLLNQKANAHFWYLSLNISLMKQLLTLCTLLLLLLSACGDNESAETPGEKTESPMRIKNTGTTIKSGEIGDLRVEIDPSRIETMRILIDGNEVLKEKAENKLIIYQWNTKNVPLGKHRIQFEGTLKDGKTRKQSIEKVIFAAYAPAQSKVKINNELPHDKLAYTQGLEFDGDRLFEGTGNRGESNLRLVDLSTGKVLQRVNLQSQYFGEGITVFNGKIYQITYTSNEGFVYSADSLKLLDTFKYQTIENEGWGLTHNEEHLIMSDGSHRLYYINPDDYSLVKTKEVYTHQGPQGNLNELEYVDGKIYANVYTTNYVVVIDEITGGVEKVVDMTELQSRSNDQNHDVLNGLAYHQATGKWYATGKYWSKLFEIEFE